LTNFFDGTTVSIAVLFTTGGVVLVRLVTNDGLEVLVLLGLTVVIERDRNFDDEFCATDDFDVGGRIVFFVGALLVDATARVDITFESFFAFVATDVDTFVFFTGVACLGNDVIVRMGNFEAFFTDKGRLLLLLFAGGVFEFEALGKFV
jgi:hypothetical protein